MSMGSHLRMLFLLSLGKAVPRAPRGVRIALARAIGNRLSRGRQGDVLTRELRTMLGPEPDEAALRAIAAEGIANHKLDLFEIWGFPRLNAERIHDYVVYEGAEHMDRALSLGKGAVVGVSHFGSWKMIIAALSYYAWPTNQIGLDPRYFVDANRPRHHNLIMEMEYRADESLPANFIYIGKLLKEVYKVLKAGEIVMNSFDGFIGEKRVEMDFLHGRNKLALGPAILAQRTGAPLVPVFAVRRPGDLKHRIIIHEPIPMDYETRDRDAAAMDAVARYKDLFETYVAEYPSHYCRTLYDRVVDPQR